MECAKNIKDLAEKSKEEIIRKHKEELYINTLRLCDETINRYLIDNAKKGEIGCSIDIMHYGNEEVFKTAYLYSNKAYVSKIEYDYNIFIEYLINHCYEIRIDKSDIYSVSGDSPHNIETISIIPCPFCE